jgi:hypothetical protein
MGFLKQTTAITSVVSVHHAALPGNTSSSSKTIVILIQSIGTL